MADKQRQKQRGAGKPFTKGDPRINRQGRPPGRAATLSEMLAEIPGSVPPLQFLLSVVANAKLPLARRLEAARDSLPYCHARAREHSHDGLTLAERIESDGAPSFPANTLFVPSIGVLREMPATGAKEGNGQ
jgi:hypothetical protein